MQNKRKILRNEPKTSAPVARLAPAKAKRTADVERKTRETSVTVTLKLDGAGRGEAKTGVPFLDHMLESFARHGFFDLKVEATGDLHIDDHHTVEDVGMVVGRAFRQALGDGAAPSLLLYEGLAARCMKVLRRASISSRVAA